MVDNVVTGDDSPFSITGSVVGILTFLLALAASTIAFFTLARDSGDELAMYRHDVRRTLQEIVNVQTSLQRFEMHDMRTEGLRALMVEMEQLLRSLQVEMDAGSTAQALGKSVKESGLRRRFMSWASAMSIRRRLNWVATRQKYLDGMNRIRNFKLEVLLAQNTYLLDEAIATKRQLAGLTEVINRRQ